MMAASKLPVAKGSAMASPLVNFATWAEGRVRAKASCPSDGSIPSTSTGADRSTSNSVKAPLPQPRLSIAGPEAELAIEGKPRQRAGSRFPSSARSQHRLRSELSVQPLPPPEKALPYR